ncbi:DUF2785 domain-containing protein [Streptococcus sp. zg-86]|uniref:DUF2785 domain-containing protein n=2 Tax=Streptococcus zhangguiae TaxID=2664091 RepID=A0A6I4RKE9_9STRE|nr:MULTISPECIES: DUF2785 domain-containing protein [unclassified Streptococcus]MTB64964.1 DUF2785 domain-containing protein [Streptococcus sp. zg-86]MTB91178.1 DUF2785 domain-containing protein [Streptococcus sp. zg-36]MWV56951.1 DUF2785 domain-containing protein [Streptococcus sp. zg-70]QTH47189.1 DUF2785 domain-containing protein [Streptococcus sp. zg-86]
MMKNRLEEKLQSEKPTYSDDEVMWLLEHIGHSDAAIRDELVYISLGRGLFEGLFTRDQFRLLVEKSLAKDYLLYRMDERGLAALTRSFTALLLGHLLEVSCLLDSPYFQLISEQEYQSIGQKAYEYLEKEQDFTGYSDNYGWVHAFAHGADLAVALVKHPFFQQEDWSRLFPIVTGIFQRLPQRFVDDEEWRLARVIYEAIKHGHLQEGILIDWIKTLHFPLETNRDFYRFSAVRSCLLEIYLQLDKENLLSGALKQVIQDWGIGD